MNKFISNKANVCLYHQVPRISTTKCLNINESTALGQDKLNCLISEFGVYMHCKRS